MLAAVYDENTDDLSKIQVKEVPKPSAGPGQVLVKVKAAAANPVDVKVMEGDLKGTWSMPLPFTMGYDVAGTVEAVGDGVADFKEGDHVFCVNWGNGSHDTEPAPGGAFAQYIVVLADKLSKKAPGVSFEESAAVALVGTTAYQALGKVGVHDGSTKRILILGGAGAVGALAIQIAKKAGCWVATTCSPRTMEYVERFGAADLLIDYRKNKWDDMEELKGIDAVFDTVGETDGFNRAKKVLKEDGSFVTIASHDVGFDPTAHPPLKFASFLCLSNDTTVQDTLMTMMDSKNLKVVVEKKFPFTLKGVIEMLETQNAGRSKGKNVLVISD